MNSIVADVDKIKQSAVASLRCFVVEVMGRDCGYLALMSALATGAERVYLPEEGITLDDLTAYVQALTEGFRSGKRLGLVIRSENADPVYTTGFLTSLFEKEGGDLFDAREAILGHIQEGGDPSPFDRIQATRLTARCIDFLSDQLESGTRRERHDRLSVGPAAVHRPDLIPHPRRAGRAATNGTAMDGATATGTDHDREVPRSLLKTPGPVRAGIPVITLQAADREGSRRPVGAGGAG